MSKKILTLITFLTITLSSTVNADMFRVSGKIVAILSDQYYAGCMVAINKKIEHNCPGQWVSLDCKGLFNDKDKESGKKKFALAIAAAQTGKTVFLSVNNLHKANGFCVVRRILVSY